MASKQGMSDDVGVDAASALQQGLAAYTAGRWAEAEAIFSQLLAERPSDVNALHLLGLVAQQQGRHARAIDLIAQASALAPQVPEIHNNLAEALRAAGRPDDAIAEYRAAIALNPNLVPAHLNLASVLITRRDFKDAEIHFRRAAAIDPSSFPARLHLGKLLQTVGRFAESAEQLRVAITLQPTSADAHANLAKTLHSLGNTDEAAATAERAVALDPNEPAYRVTLANILIAQGRTSEAARLYEQVIAQRPNEAAVRFNYAGALRLLGQVPESIRTYQDALALDPDSVAGRSGYLLTLHYSDQHDARMIFAQHLEWARMHSKPLAASGIQFNRSTSARLRIGFVSADFRDHVVARFIEPILQQLNRDRFEIICYSDDRHPDDVTHRFQALANLWRNTIALNDEELASQIAADGIDLLIDLAGHTAGNRLLTFARHPARVQATYLGYPDTTGLAAMDFRITDPHADPPGITESLHTEKLIRLPHAWCYQPPADAPAIEPSNRRSIAFGCFNALPKISEATIEVWAALLQAVPHARLVIKAGAFNAAAARKRVAERLTSRNIDRERLELHGPTASSAEHLAMYNRIDIALDTFPYAGTTTTCEALWMGVPVITLAGKTHVSRVGVSLLRAADCGEWIATSPEQYVQIATALATDANARTTFRQDARKKMRASELMDARRFALEFEAACQQMCG